MQEFRIQTSTYAPEFGRTPGAQISIVTRSGTNQFHGEAFDYLRNDIFDANDWFADNKSLPKPKERQNDFGGTFSGPIFKDRTFFFFSYEGLRLRLPQIALTTVPDMDARQNASTAVQPYLNAYPLPNGPEVLTPCDPASDPNCPPSGQNPTGAAEFNSSFSNSSTLDAYSLRVDHKLNDKLSLFARYNHSPSELLQRGQGGTYSLSTLFPARITIRTATIGSTWAISPTKANDVRFNYSRTNSRSFSYLDNFGGAVPPKAFALPDPHTTASASFQMFIFSLANSALAAGQGLRSLQRQFNVVDNLSEQKNSHSLKFGVDFRRLSPTYSPAAYFQYSEFLDVPSAESGALFDTPQLTTRSANLLFHNLWIFAQDTWKIIPRLTVTYGLRWDLDFAPASASGPNLAAVTGFNLNDLSHLALAPAGTRPFNTQYLNVAPRLGIAYELSQIDGWQTVLRSGVGVFYDLASQEAGALIAGNYPFEASSDNPGGTFPSMAVPPAIEPPSTANGGTLAAFDPHLKLPYTVQWNLALEQALGGKQTVSVTYIGAAARRLIQTAYIAAPNPNLAVAQLVTNRATSDYDAMQVKFQRRLTRGLQAIASYTWSHSLDTASAGSVLGNIANGLAPDVNPNIDRGASDFDIRNAFSASLIYQRSLDEILAFVGLDVRQVGQEQGLVDLPRTCLVPSPVIDANGTITAPLGLRDKVGLEQTNLVSRMFERWGEVPIGLLQIGSLYLQRALLVPLANRESGPVSAVRQAKIHVFHGACTFRCQPYAGFEIQSGRERACCNISTKTLRASAGLFTSRGNATRAPRTPSWVFKLELNPRRSTAIIVASCDSMRANFRASRMSASLWSAFMC
jgi:hypothetical protein